MEIEKSDSKVIPLLRSFSNVSSLAQCVSELIFNSLDGKSTAIAVRVNLQNFKIQVVDNGQGISKSNLERIGQQYMTNKRRTSSKFRSNPDFYGFRGEFLWSTVQTSQTVIITTRFDDGAGSEDTYCRTISNDCSDLVQTSTRASVGTTVTIQGFLSKLPVRQKSLKCNELDNVKKLMENLIIIHPKVSFTLRNDADGKVLLKSQKHVDVVSAVASLYPEIDGRNFSVIKVAKNRFRLEGILCRDMVESKKYQFLYVNRRPVHCQDIQTYINSFFKKHQHLVESSLSSKKNHCPVYVLHVKCPLSEVDFQMEPTKTRAAFKRINSVMRYVEKMLKSFVGDENWPKNDHKSSHDKDTCSQYFSVSQILGAVKTCGIKRKCQQDHLVDGVSEEIPATKVTKSSSEPFIMSTKTIETKDASCSSKKIEHVDTPEKDDAQKKKVLDDLLWPSDKLKIERKKKKTSLTRPGKKFKAPLPRLPKEVEKKSIDETDNNHQTKNEELVHQITLANTTLNTNNPENQKKGKDIIMDMFLKSTQIYSSGGEVHASGSCQNQEPNLVDLPEKVTTENPTREDQDSHSSTKCERAERMNQKSDCNTFDATTQRQDKDTSGKIADFSKGNESCDLFTGETEPIIVDAVRNILRAKNKSQTTTHRNPVPPGRTSVAVQTVLPADFRTESNDKPSPAVDRRNNRKVSIGVQVQQESQNNADKVDFDFTHSSLKTTTGNFDWLLKNAGLRKRLFTKHLSDNCCAYMKHDFSGSAPFDSDNFSVHMEFPDQKCFRFNVRSKSSEHVPSPLENAADFCKPRTFKNVGQDSLMITTLKDIKLSPIPTADRANEKSLGNIVRSPYFSDRNRHVNKSDLNKFVFNPNVHKSDTNNKADSRNNFKAFEMDNFRLKSAHFRSHFGRINLTICKKEKKFENRAANETVSRFFTLSSPNPGDKSCFTTASEGNDDLDKSLGFTEDFNKCQLILATLTAENTLNAKSFDNHCADRTGKFSKDIFLTAESVVCDQELDGKLDNSVFGNQDKESNLGGNWNNSSCGILQNEPVRECNLERGTVPTEEHNLKLENHLNSLKNDVPKTCAKSCCDNLENAEWIKEIDDFGEAVFVNVKSGLKTFHSPRKDSTFGINERLIFVPKGLSPILKDIGPVNRLSQKSKKVLHDLVIESYEDELLVVKWQNYIENDDPKKFFDEIYAEQSKLIEDAVPKAHGGVLNKNIAKALDLQNGRYFSKQLFNKLDVLGQFDCKFIVAFDKYDKLLLLFDQHAVHERIRVESLSKNYKGTSTKLDSDVTIFLPATATAMLKRQHETLANLGIAVEFFSDGIKVSQVPTCVYNKSKKGTDLVTLVKKLIEEVCDTLTNDNGVLVSVPLTIQSIIDSEACRGAIKFGDFLSKDQCLNNLKQLSACDLPFQCAHGRPTVAPLIQLNNGNHCQLLRHKPGLKKLK